MDLSTHSIAAVAVALVLGMGVMTGTDLGNPPAPELRPGLRTSLYAPPSSLPPEPLTESVDPYPSAGPYPSGSAFPSASPFAGVPSSTPTRPPPPPSVERSAMASPTVTFPARPSTSTRESSADRIEGRGR